MTQNELDKAASEYEDKDNLETLSSDDDIYEKSRAFKAGALWLLQKAETMAYERSLDAMEVPFYEELYNFCKGLQDDQA